VTGNLAALWQDVIPLVGPEASDLAISGGEPTIVPDDLLSVLRACREHLPHTAVHVLTNGRMFNYLSLCQAVAEIHHPDIMLGIPLYSDLSYVHDFIVQVEGAYDQTLRGMMNLARCGQRIEVRVVLLPHNIQRLHPLACFIARNLPFVEHVAWMGLEPMGHAVRNWEEVWVDPVDYQAELTEATGELLRHRINTSIYNHPLCVLNPRLWPLARKSISDWKTEYVEACQKCGVRSDCGGIFASAVLRQSRGVHPL
jgi:His-Xaa-Ser system radical SAM maturase HxsC